MLVQLGLAGGGDGGGECPNAVSPVQVVINPVPDGMSEADKVTEENVRVYSWFVHQEKTLTDAGTGHGHNIEHINNFAEKNEVILEFLRVWILLGLVTVPGDDDVGGDVPQVDDEDGETPGAGDQSSGVEEEGQERK